MIYTYHTLILCLCIASITKYKLQKGTLCFHYVISSAQNNVCHKVSAKKQFVE